ncbi:PLP-dependent transferase [Coccomyxa subellipsoidea C-169]|uniref:sphinganine-1-phosphate aldolase n=1 Tax=Coccomyxa subellipsoidea (strain C-169) TaxID=574566 RepID=I0Z8B5_COCSC|nr:PLP-dependent transferase [Coccomyxa subellipsoidea C-169]EIE26884.1 PLP-dependent transferase [Coccomyxa subellipsoidea C-169]|eukprot:XP_005651428.1 PLP-dependent transferase [Coccomyxa subellipsoidea C-169]
MKHGGSDLQHATIDALSRLRPQAEAAWGAIQQSLDPLIRLVSPHIESGTTWIDAHLGGLLPWQIAAVTTVTVLLLAWLSQLVLTAIAELKEAGVLQSLFEVIKSLPGIRGIVQRENAKMLVKIRASINKGNGVSQEQYLELPKNGMAADEVKARLQSRGKRDVAFEEGYSRVSGTLYLMGEEHCRMLNDVYASFSHTNPMHADVFPSVRQMELEVVAMTAAMLGGGPSGDPDVCGAMTSGGTESILTAVKASRDYMRARKGIRRPEMIVGQSAHAAFFKAAEYFNVKLVKVPVGNDYRVSAAAVARAMTRNTVLVVASSPCFPHGVIDDVSGIAALARKRGVCCHVDACLGGFVLPFARAAGYPVPPFDFSVPGVTSMSVDTHKFGMAHKGTSVVLYRSKDIRRHQYTRVTEWSGGLYISPGFAGSRSGALISTAWASMMHQGLQGYVKLTDQMMKAARHFAEGVKAIEGLELAGDPAMTVVAFKATNARKLNIYAVNDALSARGWHLNALQLPPALHMCFTAQHASIVEPLLKDLRECVEDLQSGGEHVKDGMAPVYGLASVSPDRNIIGEFLVAYQDVLLSG